MTNGTTSFTAASLLRPGLDELDEYKPIQPFEVLCERLDLPAEQIVKLDANENPYGPLPAVSEALAAYPWLHIYPDPQHGELRDALARFTGVPADNILPTHGADEMLDYLCRLFLSPAEAIVNCPPTFGMYAFDAQLAGAVVVDICRDENFAVDVQAIAARVIDTTGPKCKIIFATSPNNPTGGWMSDDDLLALLRLPVLVVLDEAYVEFAGKPSSANWVLEHDNLVVLRTFSKAAGIAGLRLGYGICPDWLMPVLWKFKQPYNVNVAASVAGIASLKHADQIAAVVAKLVAERQRLFVGLQAFDWLTPYVSEANFILCAVANDRGAASVAEALERSGVLVRYYDKAGLRNCIRISVGRPEQTDHLLAALRKL